MFYVCFCSICLHLYLRVVKGLKRAKLQEAAKYIWFSCLAVPGLGTLVLYLFESFGQVVTIPFGACFLRNTTGGKQQQEGWIYPSFALSALCFFLMCSIMYKVAQTVLRKTKLAKDREDSSTTEVTISGTTEEIEQKRTKQAWKKMLWLNQKTFSFVFVFVLFNTVAYGIYLRIIEVDYEDAAADVESYVGCLIGIAADPSYVLTKEDARTVPEGICGDPDEAIKFWSDYYFILLWLHVCIFYQCIFLSYVYVIL